LLQQIEEDRRVTGLLRVLKIEKSKKEVLMTAKLDDFEAKIIQIGEKMCKSNTQVIISKK
jgi:hypothetical protein